MKNFVESAYAAMPYSSSTQRVMMMQLIAMIFAKKPWKDGVPVFDPATGIVVGVDVNGVIDESPDTLMDVHATVNVLGHIANIRGYSPDPVYTDLITGALQSLISGTVNAYSPPIDLMNSWIANTLDGSWVIEKNVTPSPPFVDFRQHDFVLDHASVSGVLQLLTEQSFRDNVMVTAIIENVPKRASVMLDMPGMQLAVPVFTHPAQVTGGWIPAPNVTVISWLRVDYVRNRMIGRPDPWRAPTISVSINIGNVIEALSRTVKFQSLTVRSWGPNEINWGSTGDPDNPEPALPSQ